MTTRQAVVAEAREWLGTKYQHQQLMKGVACDCRGLVIGVARILGIVPPEFDVNGYSRTPDGVSLLAHCDQHMTRKALADLQPGDVVVGRWSTDPQHMGIVGDYVHGGLSIIHALGSVDGKGSVVEHRLTNNHFFKPVIGYQMPGVE